MSNNFQQLIKGEITRLAKREVKGALEPLKKQVQSLRSDVAALKRERVELRRALSEAKRKPTVAAATNAGEAAQPRRFSATRLKAMRQKLGLSGAETAALLEVSTQTIYNWENGNTRPSASQLEKIAEVRTAGKRALRKRLDELSA